MPLQVQRLLNESGIFSQSLSLVTPIYDYHVVGLQVDASMTVIFDHLMNTSRCGNRSCADDPVFKAVAIELFETYNEVFS